jgi:hypothetical protein
LPAFDLGPGTYGKFVRILSDAIPSPVESTGIRISLATLALTTICNHPLHGEDVRQCFAEALRTFDAITIAVVLDSDGAAFSIGDTGDTGDLRCRLANLEGGSESGQVRHWPRAPAAH